MDEPIENDYVILQLHTRVLKYLFLWPNKALSKTINAFLMYGYFVFTMCCGVPIISAAAYQFYVGIEDVNILLEALIGICDMIGNTIAYVSFLRNQRKIEELIGAINDLVKYSGSRVVRETDIECIRYTKYLLCYVTAGVMLNLSWPLVTAESCVKTRASEFYVDHDPCGMPTQNMYPFDANRYFWIVYPMEAIFCYHTCCFFSLATAIVIGFLMHLTAQLKCCCHKFEHVFDNVDQNNPKQAFINLIEYHQSILEYSQKVFSVFDFMIVVYVSVTSFPLAITAYQIVDPKANDQDRIRYAMLLIGWVMLLFLICFYAQQVRDESLKLGDSIYKSRWYQNGVAVQLNRELTIVLLRSQRTLNFKAKYLGTISLQRFVAVMKRAYSVFTLLLTVTPDH